MTTSRTELRSIIRDAATPSERRSAMRRARDAGLLSMVPEAWRTAAINAYLDEPVTAGVTPNDVAEFADYSAETRKDYVRKGWAIGPDGAYPIANEADLKRAIKAYGRSKDSDRAKVRRHIMKRARGLGKGDLIPPSWRTASASLEDSLADRVKTFNASHDRQINPTLLRTVYLRGLTAHASVAATSTLLPHQYGMARVNSFLRLAAGDPSASRVDADLLAGQ